MGKSSSPAAPDYMGQAKATAQGNLDLAKYTTQANRINQYNPYGSLTFTKTGGTPVFNEQAYNEALQKYQSNPFASMTGPAPSKDDFTTASPEQWEQTVNLSPEQQQLFDQQQQTQLGIAGLQGSALGNVQNTLGTPFDMSSVQDIADKAYGNYTSRLDPQWNQRQQGIETQLANQGIAPGTEAYTNAMRDFNSARNDAYTQAQTASFNLMPQTYNLAASARQQPLQELQGLMGLSSAQMPQFAGYAQQGQTAGPDYLNAANAQYQNQLANTNAQNAQASNTMSGLMGLAGATSKYWMPA